MSDNEVIDCILLYVEAPKLVRNIDGISPTAEDFRCVMAAYVLGLMRVRRQRARHADAVVCVDQPA